MRCPLCERYDCNGLRHSFGDAVGNGRDPASGTADSGFIRVRDDELRCARSGNPCGTDTEVPGKPCQCTPCRQWGVAFLKGLDMGIEVGAQRVSDYALNFGLFRDEREMRAIIEDIAKHVRRRHEP